jgi:transposase
MSRALLKQRVHLYHDRVRNRVRQAQRVIWQIRRWGVMVNEKDFADEKMRTELLKELPPESVLKEDLEMLFKGYDQAVEQESLIRRRLKESAKKEEQIERFTQLPGVGWIRAVTFFAIIDTPWRFKSKRALWKYCGIGLERRRSGNGPTLLRVPKRFNRAVKSALLGAAKSAAATSDNPFVDQYQRWLNAGCSPRISRRNLARSQAAVMWGMWKSGNAYEPKFVGMENGACNEQLTEGAVSR